VTAQFALYARPNELDVSRLGVTTTRRLGNAVVRNRARRLVREAYRKHQEALPGGFDFVVVVRHKLLALKSTELEPVLLEAAQKAAAEGRS
jgi:ribonuclease P protein component